MTVKKIPAWRLESVILVGESYRDHAVALGLPAECILTECPASLLVDTIASRLGIASNPVLRKAELCARAGIDGQGRACAPELAEMYEVCANTDTDPQLLTPLFDLLGVKPTAVSPDAVNATHFLKRRLSLATSATSPRVIGAPPVYIHDRLARGAEVEFALKLDRPATVLVEALQGFDACLLSKVDVVPMDVSNAVRQALTGRAWLVPAHRAVDIEKALAATLGLSTRIWRDEENLLRGVSLHSGRVSVEPVWDDAQPLGTLRAFKLEGDRLIAQYSCGQAPLDHKELAELPEAVRNLLMDPQLLRDAQSKATRIKRAHLWAGSNAEQGLRARALRSLGYEAHDPVAYDAASYYGCDDDAFKAAWILDGDIIRGSVRLPSDPPGPALAFVLQLCPKLLEHVNALRRREGSMARRQPNENALILTCVDETLPSFFGHLPELPLDVALELPPAWREECLAQLLPRLLTESADRQARVAVAVATLLDASTLPSAQALQELIKRLLNLPLQQWKASGALSVIERATQTVQESGLLELVEKLVACWWTSDPPPELMRITGLTPSTNRRFCFVRRVFDPATSENHLEIQRCAWLRQEQVRLWGVLEERLAGYQAQTAASDIVSFLQAWQAEDLLRARYYLTCISPHFQWKHVKISAGTFASSSEFLVHVCRSGLELNNLRDFFAKGVNKLCEDFRELLTSLAKLDSPELPALMELHGILLARLITTAPELGLKLPKTVPMPGEISHCNAPLYIPCRCAPDLVGKVAGVVSLAFTDPGGHALGALVTRELVIQRRC